MEQLVDLTLLGARRNARVPPEVSIDELTPVALCGLLDTPGRSVHPHRHTPRFHGLASFLPFFPVLLQEIADRFLNQFVEPFLLIDRKVLKLAHKLKIEAETILLSRL